jgi:hypothetical protein
MELVLKVIVTVRILIKENIVNDFVIHVVEMDSVIQQVIVFWKELREFKVY